MIHETTHVVQHYRGRGNPGWLVEGVADYFRFFIFEPGQGRPGQPEIGPTTTTATGRPPPSSPTWSRSTTRRSPASSTGGCARAITRRAVFKEITGKTLGELGEEWMASLRK